MVHNVVLCKYKKIRYYRYVTMYIIQRIVLGLGALACISV